MNKITPKQFRTFAQDPMEFFRSLRVPGADPSKAFGDVWGDFQEEAFREFTPSLMAVAKGLPRLHRGFWLERTKGASKDSDVGCCLLWLQLFSRIPLLIELGAEKAEQAAETHKAMQDIVRLNPWMKEKLDFQVNKILAARTGVTCDFLATSRTGAHGSRPNVTVCNELSHVTTHDFILTMLDNANKLPNNLMVIATNAGFLHTWQYDLREECRRDSDWWWQKYDRVAPWIPEKNVESARKINSALRFNRLWKGNWSPQEGDAIDPEDIAGAITLDGPMSTEEICKNGWVCILGADAGIKHDHAALVILAVQYNNPTIRVARCESWMPAPGGKIDLTQMDAAIARAHEELPCLGMCYDATQMELMVQQAERRGLACDPISFKGSDPDEMVRVLLDTFRNQNIKMYRDEALLRDLHRLVIKETLKNQYKLDAIRDEYGHADRAIALAMALPAAVRVARHSPPSEEEGAEHLIEV